MGEQAKKSLRCDEVSRLLRQHLHELEGLGVARLSLFGPITKGRAHTRGAIHFLVEFSKPAGLIAFIRLRRRLSEILGRRVELVTLDVLDPEQRDTILHEAVRVA